MRWQLEDIDFDIIDRAPIARCCGAVESFHRKDEFSANLRQLQGFAERAWALLAPVLPLSLQPDEHVRHRRD